MARIDSGLETPSRLAGVALSGLKVV